MVEPWKASTNVFELGLWSMLSNAAVVKTPTAIPVGHGPLARLTLSVTLFPRAADNCSKRS